MQGFIALAEESLHRAQAFLDTHTSELADVNVAAPRAELDDAVRQLSAHAADQEATRTNVRGDTLKKQSLYDAVRKDHMIPIAQIARCELRGDTDFADIKVPENGIGAAKLVAAARGVAQVARRHEAVFVRAGLAADFVDRLSAAADALEQVIKERGSTRLQRTGATAALGAQVSRGRKAVRLIDASLRRVLKDNAPLQAEWRSARRVGLKTGGPRVPSAVSSVPVAVPASAISIVGTTGAAAVVPAAQTPPAPEVRAA